ncbi:XRE family transcriptional regulator [Catenuloplanes atrovinosus]|uniref:XRE family transcriptional regulator n=1 Tax=Catenuloplanes atrovinosus TaxID=137266 RepID=A0AAE4C7L1_9ACTN|nr:XRE family transcriptional regulator [Catenuloplanes atrovinosus]MDR7273597.1 hypothetical protein [Catenuloplanes atrovinosus]
MADEAVREQQRPPWARRIRNERLARRWSQPEAVKALRLHSARELPSDASLLRSWKRWESGDSEPDEFYKPLIAQTFGTVTAAMFPRQSQRDVEGELLNGSGLDTVELLARVRRSDVSPATLDALKITADRLCCEYPYAAPEQLHIEGKAWLQRITGLLDQRLTLKQHREVLSLAGTVALLIGCVEYDMGQRRDSEATRQAALSLGGEAEHAGIIGWAHEMRAWYNLTQGNYPGVVAAAEAGAAAAPHQGVAVQLAGQRAKAWARLKDRRQVELALESGRKLLEGLPLPEDLDHHFVVDPAKFDFYAMDCYRTLGEDDLASLYAHEVIRSSTAPNGTEHKPMRIAEARITLGVTTARSGDLEGAVLLGRQALQGERRSIPSLLMVSQDLAATLRERYPDEKATAEYLDELKALAA